MDTLKNKSGHIVIFPVLGAVLLIAVLSAYYFRRQVNILRRNPSQAAQEETRDVVARVSKLIILPEGEQPTLAVVTDPEKLKDQPFFAHAKKGDKILIYPNAKKAILYDPVADKIIEVAPVSIGGNDQGQAPAESSLIEATSAKPINQNRKSKR